jgi:hypothetical protein
MVRRLAAGGKRIRTPGPTCGCGSLWANGTERCRRIRQWTPMDSSGTKPSASAPGRADRRERTSPMPEPKPRRWGQRSGAVRGLGRAGRDPRQPGRSGQVRDRLDQRSSKAVSCGSAPKGTPELKAPQGLLSLIDSPFGWGPDLRRSGPPSTAIFINKIRKL